MSAILFNSGATTKIGIVQPQKETKIKIVQTHSKLEAPPEPLQEENRDDEESREERKATGRSVAIFIFISLMCLALYHVIQKKTTILAGVLVPALILFTYTFFVIHVGSRKKKRRNHLQASNDPELSSQSELHSQKQELQKKISTTSNPSSIISSSSIPSTSGLPTSATQKAVKVSIPKLTVLPSSKDSKQILHTDSTAILEKKNPHSFKKTKSQTFIQVQNNIQPRIHSENEKKKMKKSRSFDKNIHLI